MPWVSNRTAHNIIVSITKAHGGSDSNYTVEPASYYGPAAATAESRGSNYWSRSGPETLTLVIDGKEKTKFEVQPDDHVNIYTNSYEIFTAKGGKF
jgi:hypothetical protein